MDEYNKRYFGFGRNGMHGYGIGMHRMGSGMGMGRGYGMGRRGFRAGFGLKYFILAVLSEGRATGAEITRRIEEMSNYYWHPSPGSIYLLLKDLASDGYIEIEEENGRKYYKITKEGKEIIDNSWFPFKEFISREPALELEQSIRKIMESKDTLGEAEKKRILSLIDDLKKNLD
ncbi:MAG: PadR family transcriptional regulator [Candidatus Micrarchaeales archaeon]